MKSILDDAPMWHLDRIAFDGRLQIFLVELILGGQEHIVIAGKDLGYATKLERARNSREVRIVFDNPLAYQVVNESYTSFDKDARRESGDTGALFVFETSRFLDQIRANGLIPALVDSPAKDFLITTGDYVIDVASTQPPKIDCTTRPATIETAIPDVHDAVLDTLHLDWAEGVAVLNLRTASGPSALIANGLLNLQFARREPWGPSAHLNRVVEMQRDPSTPSVLTCKIEMQSGDLLEFEARSFEFGRSGN